eukprot:3911196-Pyramimonas_sp.AAC.1
MKDPGANRLRTSHDRGLIEGERAPENLMNHFIEGKGPRDHRVHNGPGATRRGKALVINMHAQRRRKGQGNAVISLKTIHTYQ